MASDLRDDSTRDRHSAVYNPDAAVRLTAVLAHAEQAVEFAIGIDAAGVDHSLRHS